MQTRFIGTFLICRSLLRIQSESRVFDRGGPVFPSKIANSPTCSIFRRYHRFNVDQLHSVQDAESSKAAKVQAIVYTYLNDPKISQSITECCGFIQDSVSYSALGLPL